MPTIRYQYNGILMNVVTDQEKNPQKSMSTTIFTGLNGIKGYILDKKSRYHLRLLVIRQSLISGLFFS